MIKTVEQHKNKIIIREDNLDLSNVKEVSLKARAILIDDNNKVLVANYADVYLLPGGSVEDDETIFDAITRELTEEVGQVYTKDELKFLVSLDYYQKDYPKLNNKNINRLVKNYYFVGKLKSHKFDKINLTEKEKNNNFNLQLIPLDEIEQVIKNNKNNNPRNIYFQTELLVVFDRYKQSLINEKSSKIKKLGVK